MIGGLTLSLHCIRHFPTAIFLVAISPFISAVLSHESLVSSGIGPVLGSYLRIGMLLMMGFVGIAYSIKQGISFRNRFSFHFAALLLFILLAIGSAVYSIDRLFTVVRSFTFLSLFCFLTGLHVFLKDQIDVDRVLNAVFLAICLFIIANLFALLLLPPVAWPDSMSNRFQGLWGHPNTLGSLSMVSYPILMWKRNHTTGFKKHCIIGIAVLCAAMHILSGSRGTLLASTIGIGIWFIALKKYIKFFSFIVLTAFLGVAVLAATPSRFERNDDDNLNTLTGRTDFWQAAFTVLLENPLTGYGYGVGGKVLDDPRFRKKGYDNWSGGARSSLHQGYLSTAVEMGIVAFSIWIVAIVIPIWRCRHLPPNDYKAVVLSTFVACLVLNFVETTITGGNGIAAVIFWIMWTVGGKLPDMFPSRVTPRMTGMSIDQSLLPT